MPYTSSPVRLNVRPDAPGASLKVYDLLNKPVSFTHTVNGDGSFTVTVDNPGSYFAVVWTSQGEWRKSFTVDSGPAVQPGGGGGGASSFQILPVLDQFYDGDTPNGFSYDFASTQNWFYNYGSNLVMYLDPDPSPIASRDGDSFVITEAGLYTMTTDVSMTDTSAATFTVAVTDTGGAVGYQQALGVNGKARIEALAIPAGAFVRPTLEAPGGGASNVVSYIYFGIIKLL